MKKITLIISFILVCLVETYSQDTTRTIPTTPTPASTITNDTALQRKVTELENEVSKLKYEDEEDFPLRFSVVKNCIIYKANAANVKEGYITEKLMRVRNDDADDDSVQNRGYVKLIVSKTGSNQAIKIGSGATSTSTLNKGDVIFIKELSQNNKTRHVGFTAGVLALPIKIRFKTKDKVVEEGDTIKSKPLKLTADVAAGPFIGLKIETRIYTKKGVKAISNLLGAFAGPSFVNIQTGDVFGDSTLADQKIKSSLSVGFSYGAGYIFSLDHFQAGLIVGFDLIGGDESKRWVYQNRPWLSLAIGYRFTGRNKK